MYKNKYNKRAIGHNLELLAGEYLIENGLVIIEYNYFNRTGEIDIVAKDGMYIVFVEVKYRSGSSYGTAVEAVNVRKQKTIRRIAEGYLMERGLRQDSFVRFDVIAIDGTTDLNIKWIKNAF